MKHFRQLGVLLCLLAVTACSPGCQRNNSDRFKPANAIARQAIETALSQWKAGVKYGTITESAAKVIVEEPLWKSGNRLQNYEIMEEMQGNDYPQFKVKLLFVGKPEMFTEYLVVGVDPPIVYSKVEFVKARGM